MFCGKCGAKNPEESNFCNKCGSSIKVESVHYKTIPDGESRGVRFSRETLLADKIFKIASIVAIVGLFLGMITYYITVFVFEENGAALQLADQNDFKESAKKMIKERIEKEPQNKLDQIKVTKVNILNVSGATDIRIVKVEIETDGKATLSHNKKNFKFIKYPEDNLWHIGSSYDED